MVTKPDNYPLFYKLLANTLVAVTSTNFMWFALTFWAILETRSVIVASFIAGIFAVTNMFGAIFFGGFVDHHQKRTSMLLSSAITLAAFTLAAFIYMILPTEVFSDAHSPYLWLLIIIILIGAVAGNLRMITLSTTVTLLFDEGKDKANGLIGAMQGVSFCLTSILSGVVIGFFGFQTALIAAVLVTAATLLHVLTLNIPHVTIAPHDETKSKLDVRGTIAIILSIPGLAALIAFTTFNNFIGGTFMALMDIYGLSMVSVQTWGTIWGFVSLGMIAGSIYVAKKGVGKYPLRTIMVINMISWTTCIFFPLQPSIIFLTIGITFWLTLFPIAEAAEQTLIQTIVPPERQGRVFGLGQSVESAVSPITAFLVGPIAQVFYIPFMTTGSGVTLIGDWFGTGEARGIALVFITAGVIGVVVTSFAWRSKSYKHLSAHYTESSTT